jgi:mono/diheme cytochrome c family protein
MALEAILYGAEPASAVDGAELFRSKCVACHGPNGEGTPVGPALRGDAFIVKGTPDEIKKVVMSGRTEAEKKYPNIMNAMPGGLATEPEAEALVVYLKGGLQK